MIDGNCVGDSVGTYVGTVDGAAVGVLVWGVAVLGERVGTSTVKTASGSPKAVSKCCCDG